MLAAAEDLEDQLVALVAVLAREGLHALEGRRLQRLEPIPLEDVADRREYVLPYPQVARQEIPRARGRLELLGRHD